VQVPIEHAKPLPVQMSGSQHGWPAPPHAAQLLFMQTTSLAVH
jgi:hypothetical protein